MSDPNCPIPAGTSTSSRQRTTVPASDSELLEDDVFAQIQSHPYMSQNLPLLELICKTDYLQRYPSWLSYCGPENKKTFSPTYIARNDTIWELVFTERGFMDMLLMVRDLYMVPFPEFEPGQFDGCPSGISTSTLREALFPGLELLIAAHERILRPLLALHDQSTNHVVSTLGSVLVKLFDEETQAGLSELYGGFMFAQKRIRQHLQLCKSWPPVARFFEKCRQDPRSARRSLEDCHMVIVQRWTKVETLLDVIIRNTLNHPSESEKLEAVRNAVRSLLKGAESVMTAREHENKLREFAAELLIPTSAEGDADERRLLEVMQLPSTRLVNYGPLRITPYASGHQVAALPVEATGVALDSCFFVLRKSSDSGGYQLFKGTKMPPILWWGQVYGYFRPSLEKNGFFLILHPESVLTSFICSTADELIRWEKIMNDGFSQWRESAPISMETLGLELEQARSTIEQRWIRTEAVLDLLHELDADLEYAWHARTFVCLALIEERLKSAQSELSASDSDSIPISSNSDGNARFTPSYAQGRSTAEIDAHLTTVMNNNSSTEVLDSQTFICGRNSISNLNRILSMFQQILVRLQFSLAGSASGGLSRSASDVEQRKRPPSKPIRKNETFSVRDNTVSGDPAVCDVGRKQHLKKHDTHRLSTTMVGLFRSSNRDKGAGISSSQNAFDQTVPSLSQSKSSHSRLPSAIINSVGLNSARHSSISTASPLPGFNPRPSLTVNEDTCSQQSSLSITGSAHGSSNFLTSQSSMETLSLLKELTAITEEFFPMVFRLRTRNDEVEASNLRLKMEKERLESILTRAKQSGFVESTCSRCGGATGSDSDSFSTFSIKQGTEKLRRDVEIFRKQSEEWDKEYKRRRDSLERDQTKLGDAWRRYDEACALLERKQRQYEEDRKTLQRLIDLHTNRGVDFSGVNMPEIQLPDPTPSFNNPSRMNARRSSGSVAELDLLDLRPPCALEAHPTHSRSVNDNLYRAETVSSRTGGDLRVPDLTGASIRRQPATPSAASIRNDELPMHLRGSLLNQPGGAKDPSTFIVSPHSASPGSVTKSNSLITDSPNNSNAALWRLADSSKPHSATKTTKSGFFRRS